MDHYVTGTIIKQLRERKRMTQAQLGAELGVSHKTVSKWETSRGLPDITLLEPLAKALGISVSELLAGEYVINNNKAANMLRSEFYVCPICGNTIHAMGQASVSCCGILLPPLEAEEPDEEHWICCIKDKDEYVISMEHEMTKLHHLSFFAYVTCEKLDMVKLYAEGRKTVRFPVRGHGMIYAYCNKHGLTKYKV